MPRRVRILNHVSPQAGSKTVRTVGAGVVAQHGELVVAQLETDEQAVANDKRCADSGHELLVDMHRDATLATGRPEGGDGRHEALCGGAA